MIGIQVTDEDVMKEVAAVSEMTEEVLVLVMIEAATDEIEATIVVKKRHTLETTGNVASVETQTSHSELSVIGVVLQKAVKAECPPDNGVVTIEEQVIETMHHSQDLETGNVANAKK